MRALMGDVDVLNRSINDYNKYTQMKQRSQATLENMIQKRVGYV